MTTAMAMEGVMAMDNATAMDDGTATALEDTTAMQWRRAGMDGMTATQWQPKAQ